MISIRNFSPRLYQQNILATCKEKNCLVVLPTGLGKTKTAILLSVHRLNLYPNSKVLFLTPTKPLANQIYKEYKNSTDLEEDKIALLTGEVPPNKRMKKWQESRIIVSTPQGCLNDILNANILLSNVSLLVLDEVHRCTGDYDYVLISKKYKDKSDYPRIIGLTASPGSDISKISEVCRNANVEAIEIRTEHEPDVIDYVQEIKIEWIKLDLSPEFLEIKKFLEVCLLDRIQKLKNLGFVPMINPQHLSKKNLLLIQSKIQARISRGEKNFMLWPSVSLVAETIKIHHALELIETQGSFALYEYMKKMFQDSENTKVKALKHLVKDLNFKSAFLRTESLINKGIDHPKITELSKIIKSVISKDPNSKTIVFNHYRNTASNIERILNQIPGVKAKLFVGQLKKSGIGLTQKEQFQIIEDFKSDTYNVLVSTSIGEEGLDIPKVDLVIFYEPVPSAIRSIQRRGRTARHQEGKLIVLMAKNSRDETYHWVSHNKEKRMHRAIESLKNKLKFESNESNESKQQTLTMVYDRKSRPKIIADFRENSSSTIKELSKLEVEISMQNLSTADYVVSDRVGIELKTKQDFVNSIIDGRLLSQMRDLRENFANPLLIISGDEDIYAIRNVHSNAIRGMLAAIVLNYNIPVLFTKNPLDTAHLIKIIATREQKDLEREPLIRAERKPLTVKELQEFIVQSLPGIGSSIAKSLLQEHKTIKAIFNLTEDELQKIPKIGAKKAGEIRKILDENYKY